jgi:hypothetical protein
MIAGRVGYADFTISKNGTLLYALNLAEKCRYELRGPYPADPRVAGGGGNAFERPPKSRTPKFSWSR